MFKTPMKKPLTIAFGFLLCTASAPPVFGWGVIAHKFIVQNAANQLPAAMIHFKRQDTFFISHAGAADTRRYSDSTEGKKHFINPEDFPDYGHMSSNYDSLVLALGLATVEKNGVVPWAVVWTLDSVTALLKKNKWIDAYDKASDLAHYIGDACMPLHCTANYDGHLTGNDGIHSRYETVMIDSMRSKLTFIPDSVYFLMDPIKIIWECMWHSKSLVDSILKADSTAKAQSGWDGKGAATSAYITALWNSTRTCTQEELNRAAMLVARFWYTAYVNAGLASIKEFAQYQQGDGRPRNAKYSLVNFFFRPTLYGQEADKQRTTVFSLSGRFAARPGSNAGIPFGVYIVKMIERY